MAGTGFAAVSIDPMSEASLTISRREPEPLPANIGSVQPGGGVCYRLELAWGRLRRWYLRHFRPGYVARMARLRQGDPGGSPQEVLDPRDLKYFRNVSNVWWRGEDDPFAWRERIPFARWGLAELQIMGWPLLAATVALALVWWPLAIVPAIPLGLIVYFFRDPQRRVPEGPGLLVAPADGVVAEVTQVEHDDFIGGPAVRIGIFLSIFNVHINRSPGAARVIKLRYQPGKFMNALNPESALYNENMWIGLEEDDYPHRPMVVRQISGAIARRIVCDLKPGQSLQRGEKFGMIKLGSRTELIVPQEEQLRVLVQVGQVVHGGETVLARYDSNTGDAA
jgi:phosphatidylserine decarboxylase